MTFREITSRKIVATFLTTLLFMSVIVIVFSSDIANGESDITVLMKIKKKITLLAVKNNSDTPVYSVELKSTDGSIQFVKAKDWDRKKIDTSTVMIQTDDRPLTRGKNMIVLLMMDNVASGLEWKAFDSINNVLASGALIAESMPPSQETVPPKVEKKQEQPKPTHLCKGHAACFTATVTAIVDGDTIDVNDGVNTVRIRLALTNTPERGQPLYNQAVQFTANLCSVGSIAGIDEDDGQTEGSYDRMIAKVFCGNKILNLELLNAGLAVIDTRFCNESEFRMEDWAQRYGCGQEVKPEPKTETESESKWVLVTEVNPVSAYGPTPTSEIFCIKADTWRVVWTGGTYAVRVYTSEHQFVGESSGTEPFAAFDKKGCFYVFPVHESGQGGAFWVYQLVYGNENIEVEKYLPEPNPDLMQKFKNAKEGLANLGEAPTTSFAMDLGSPGVAFYKQGKGTTGKVAYECVEEVSEQYRDEMTSFMEVSWSGQDAFHGINLYKEADSDLRLIYSSTDMKGEIYVYEVGCYYAYADVRALSEFSVTLQSGVIFKK
jgi:endonuclease YncB( thermonuclease family)